MRPKQSLFRFSAAMAIGGLVAGPALAPPARAQDAQPTDPPARVGRLASVTGTVSFHTADATDWQSATPNYPVTAGNAFWTEPQANAALGLGDVKLVLDQQTEADIDTLDDTAMAVTEPQGATYLHVRNQAAGDSNTVTTPRGVVTITAAGRYEIVAGDDQQPTRVEVIDGGADVALGNATLHVGPHQAAVITGSDQASFQGSVGAAANDAFLTAELAKEQAPPPQPVSQYTPPPLVQHMTGYEELQTVGEWQPSPEYGHVWYPPAEANFVPYRNGHWAFVAPWGWTWVDNAPWGFAPFHYGRWAQFGGRWGWVPVDPGVHVDFAVARPVYAPALVSFVGIGAGIGVGVGVGFGGVALSASVGWIPLGPREPYIPPFRASPAYVREVNVTHVTNVTNITNKTVTINNYANARAVTVVPAAAMTTSQPVARAVQPVTPQQLAAAKPMAQAPVQPTAATAGVTPAVAKQMSLPPAPAGVKPATEVAAHPAPGPAIAAPAAAKPAATAAAGAKPGTPAAKPALPMLTKPNPASAPQTHAVPAAAAPAAKPAPATAPAAKPAEAPAAKPAEKPAEKVEEKPAAKPAEAPAAKPAEKPAEKVEEKPVAKPAAAPAAKPAEKPAEKVEEKPAPKPAAVPAAKPAEKPAEKVEEKPAPKPAAAPAAKPAEKPAEKVEEKPAPKPAPAAAQAKPAPAAKPAAEPAKPAAAQAKPPVKPEPKPEPKKCPNDEKTC